MKRYRRTIGGVLFALVLSTSPILAVTAGDVLTKMSSDEQFAYISGSLDAAMYLASAREHNNARAECIVKWYYGKDTGTQAAKEMIAAFKTYHDQIAVGVVEIVIERHCGK